MKQDLMTSAFFSGVTTKNDTDFYFESFSSLKLEFDFDYGAIFYKTSQKFELKFEFNPEQIKNFGEFKLKIPIKMQNSTIGYFLFIKKTKFSKEDKLKAETACQKASEIIKEFEFSKIFKNQLTILQDAILNKNKLTIQLEEQNKKLIQTDKIRSEFLANVSHELRTPLNSIIGFSTALKDEMAGKLNDKQKEYASKILSSAIHLTGLINGILDMTKLESGAMNLNLKPQNPNSVIEEAINIIEPLAEEKNIKIETKFEFKGQILIDTLKFRQIIYNLSGNAIKFSHENSKIIISTKEKDGFVYIKVKDFGIGIKKSNQKKIFEKFVQLDNIYTKKYSSTGLGLTITKELTELHNAKIRLTSTIGKGSTFTLIFNKE